MSLRGMAVRFGGVLGRCCGVTFFVVLGGFAMRLRRLFVMLGGFVVAGLRHWVAPVMGRAELILLGAVTPPPSRARGAATERSTVARNLRRLCDRRRRRTRGAPGSRSRSTRRLCKSEARRRGRARAAATAARCRNGSNRPFSAAPALAGDGWRRYRLATEIDLSSPDAPAELWVPLFETVGG